MTADSRRDDLYRGTSRAGASGNTSASAAHSEWLYGPVCAPQGLLDFVRAQSVRDACAKLGVSRGTVNRLRQGYWPADPRKIMQAWSAYQGHAGVVGTSWFIRRIRAGGVVRHAGHDFTAHGLAAHTGHMLAVTRSPDGSLLAQTLALPSQRMPLVPVAQLHGGAALPAA